MIIYEAAIVISSLMALLFMPCLALIVFLNCRHFCQGETLNTKYSSQTRVQNKTKNELAVLAKNDNVDEIIEQIYGRGSKSVVDSSFRRAP